MRIKKLDWFVVKSFVMLLAGTFFVCLFIFMMQFLWRYVEDLVGKGLDMWVMAKFFFYSSLMMIPMSLPLAVLLASLITFGNFGERSELLAMKAAGIPLIKVMRPLIVVVAFISCLSFYFQNVIGPKATTELYALLFSIKQKSPELDIPEGAFYHELDGYNLYVEKKDKKTGILYGVMIYNFSDGFENAHIIVADSGRMEMTADKKYLNLHLYSGEQFENLRSQSMKSKNVPYRRESFREKHSLIAFDANFNQMDAGYLSNQAAAKDMMVLQHSIDSMTARFDSIGRNYYKDAKRLTYKKVELSGADSVQLAGTTARSLSTDSVFSVQSYAKRQDIVQRALNKVQSQSSDLSMKTYVTSDGDKNIRRHKKEWWGKITLSLACLIFFFIGAPLGAIIRKGGLGLPVVISVIIFVLYYIIDSGSTRVARSGEMNIILGTWMSTIVLAPIGAFFTYKSNKDSVVFNLEMYLNFFRWLFGMRPSRHVFKKEVIIKDPNYAQVSSELTTLSGQCQDYLDTHQLGSAPNYYRIFFVDGPSNAIAEISERMDSIIEELSNSKDGPILNQLNNYPIVSTQAHKSPSDHRWLNIIFGMFVPVGLFFYFRIWLFGKRLDKDLKRIIQTNTDIQNRIKNNSLDI